MSIQQNKQVGFPLAFEIYSYGSIDWNNPPLTREFPYLSDELLTEFLDTCIASDLLKFIVFPANLSLIGKSFSKKQHSPSIYEDSEQINKRKRYFVQRIIRKKGAIIGVNGEPTFFLRLFRSLFWSINGVELEQANSKISNMVDSDTLALALHMPCSNLFFISAGGDPIYLLQRSNFSQVIDI